MDLAAFALAFAGAFGRLSPRSCLKPTAPFFFGFALLCTDGPGASWLSLPGRADFLAERIEESKEPFVKLVSAFASARASCRRRCLWLSVRSRLTGFVGAVTSAASRGAPSFATFAASVYGIRHSTALFGMTYSQQLSCPSQTGTMSGPACS